MADTRIKEVVVNGTRLYLPQIKVWGLYWRTFNREDSALYEVYRLNEQAQWSDYFEGPHLQKREDIYYHKDLTKDVLTEYRRELDSKLKEARIHKALKSKYFR